MRARILLLVSVLGLAALVGLPGVAAAQSSGGKKPDKSAEECIKVLEGGGKPEDCHKAPNLILPETNEVVWGSLSFLVLFFVLAKLAFPAVRKGMDARADRIRRSLDEAEQAKNEAQRVLEEYRSQLADARNEAAGIIEEARQAADSMRRDLIHRAEAESAELRERAAADIRAQTDRALADLRSKVAELAMGAAEAVVVSSLDRDTQMRLIEDYINRVGAARA
jgi:F-type H+-transporting ATPase subunit b